VLREDVDLVEVGDVIDLRARREPDRPIALGHGYP
jgi:hypothetical protein